MTPTLAGRIQTRIALMLFVGLPWTLLVTPLLPRPRGIFGEGAALADVYRVTLFAWATVLVVGCVLWEPIYHLLMQLRWEKDWPILFGLFTVVNEAVVAWLIVRHVGPMAASGALPAANRATFIVHIVTTWLLVWLAAIGPMRIVLIRWRFRGGRVL